MVKKTILRTTEAPGTKRQEPKTEQLPAAIAQRIINEMREYVIRERLFPGTWDSRNKVKLFAQDTTVDSLDLGDEIKVIVKKLLEKRMNIVAVNNVARTTGRTDIEGTLEVFRNLRASLTTYRQTIDLPEDYLTTAIERLDRHISMLDRASELSRSTGSV
ncbi:MAG: hypothetical protein ABH842_02785 [Candidatus Micrarchaeota archaeon]